MLKQNLNFRLVLVLGFCLSLLCSSAFAQGYGNRDNRGNGRGAGVRVSRNTQGHVGYRHYYRNGNWYRHGLFGSEIPVPALYNGVLVDSLPPAYTVVLVSGNTYYYANNTYFQQLPQGGYAVVSVPNQ